MLVKKLLFCLPIFFNLQGISISDELKIEFLNSLIPMDINLRQRVLTGAFCSDCDYLPKAENAGRIVVPINGSPYQIMHNGLKIKLDCYYGSWMTKLIELLHGHHEPQEEVPFFEVLKLIPKDAVMIELGSYWGYYSMWFQQEISGARNYLIEPDPKNLEIGKENFSMNGMQGHFSQYMVGACSCKNQDFVDWDYNHHPVDVISIDDFVKMHQIPFIHILHSDIQGAEVDMLKGCENLIRQKRIGYFFISTHRGVHETCLKFLTEAGLEILVSFTREESFTADGLIVAKLPELPGTAFTVSKRSADVCKYIEELKGNK